MCYVYTVTYHHDVSCFLVAGGYASLLMRIAFYAR